MIDNLNLKEKFLKDRDRIFNDPNLLKDSYKFCVRYSLLVEEYIIKISHRVDLGCSLTSAGSFSRRKLSPYSDIDLMFILPSLEGKEEIIQNCVASLWDYGIEVSHTVREFADIDKFLKEDLHSFTQFFETRFMLGSAKVYNEWNQKLFDSLTEENKQRLIFEFFEDIETRHKKYGNSPKVLEPNVKFSAGGLRDLHAVEWMHSLKNNLLLTDQHEITQTETFLNLLKVNKLVNPREINQLLESYKLILNIRNRLHLLNNRKNDRFEFSVQKRIGESLNSDDRAWHGFMKQYFEAAGIIHRFSKTMMKRFYEQISQPISEYLSIKLDDDYILKGNVISINDSRKLNMSEILRAFYYRGLNDARFDEHLRSLIISSAQELGDSQPDELSSSVFFREILKLPKNAGIILSLMNELGVLSIYMPEFKELIGYFQPGVYHCYTADEHTLIALRNLEKLEEEDSYLANLYRSLKEKDILFLAVLFHDIAKPFSLSGHEIIGAEVASSVMERLGYDTEEISMVQFLVRHHLTMEQVAFRRNLNDPSTLDNFTEKLPSLEALNLLYLLTYADLSAVSSIVWTQWKSELLDELYRKTFTMIEEKITGEELIYNKALSVMNGSVKDADENVINHIEAIDDLGYLQHYSQEEINKHVEEIERGSKVSVFFKDEIGFTNVSVITRDSPSLLSKLCGALSINDLNIHGAKIFTRNDGIVIDSFSVTDFRTHELVAGSRYEKIGNDLELSVTNELQIGKEFSKVQNKWWRIEKKLFKRKGNINIEFERHDKFTIIDVHSPDRLGLLYQITKKMNDLGLSIYYAKISTKGDDVVDAFYVLNQKGKKISSEDYPFIKLELTKSIEEML